MTQQNKTWSPIFSEYNVAPLPLGPLPMEPSPASAHLLVERIEKLERKVENAETEIGHLKRQIRELEADKARMR